MLLILLIKVIYKFITVDPLSWWHQLKMKALKKAKTMKSLLKKTEKIKMVFDLKLPSSHTLENLRFTKHLMKFWLGASSTNRMKIQLITLKMTKLWYHGVKNQRVLLIFYKNQVQWSSMQMEINLNPWSGKSCILQVN